MPAWFRLWEKKRGGRRTGSQLAGSLGEGLFFAGFFLLGSAALGGVVAAQWLEMPAAEPYLTGWSFYFVILVLSSFVLVGGVGLAYTFFRTGNSAERRAVLVQETALLPAIETEVEDENPLPGVPEDDPLTDSPGITLAYRLPMTDDPTWRVIPAAAFCVLWNLTVAVLLIRYFSDPVDWLFRFVVLAFVAIGAASILFLVREIGLAAGLGPTVLEISDHPLLPGRRYEFFFSQGGRYNVEKMEVVLACDEEATYSHGTDIRTDSQRVFEQPVFSAEDFAIDPASPLEHHGELVVPVDAMHSFQSNHNMVQWKLVVRGSLPGWPEWERSFPVLVYPRVIDPSRA